MKGSIVSSSLLDIDLIPTNVVIYKKQDDDFIFVDINEMAQKTDNINAKELIGKKLTIAFPGVKEFGLFDILKRVHESGKSELLESAFYEDSRISGWRRNEVKKLSDGNLVVFYDDKTVEVSIKNQLSEAEQLLEHQKKIFQHMMENSEFISVQGYDDNHEVICWNRASETLYGYTAAEAKGKKLEDLIIPEFMTEMVHNGIEKWINEGVEIPSSELTLHDKDGNDVNVFSQHVMIKVDAAHHEMYCMDIDLKEIKHLQKELSIQKNLLETIFHVIPDMIWLKDRDGVYMYCNQKFEHFFGAKREEIVGHTDFDFVDADLANFFRRNDLKALEKNAPRRNEEYLTFADGSYEGIFETTKTPMLDDDKNVIGVLGIAHDINKRKENEEKLKIYASHDMLTGLANRGLFIERLKQLLKQREVKGTIHAVLFVDLDHFKIINDEKGHATGDKVLVEVSHRLKGIVRKGDTLARFGGDEFTILLENINNASQASVVAQKILNILRRPICIGEEKYYITASIGISLSPDDSRDVDALLHYSDIAMYRAKENGKDAYKFYTKN